MHLSPTASTVLALAGLLTAQAPDAPSPYPRFMPGYEFHSSLATALNAARGERRIVVYSHVTVTLRDRLTWLLQQHAIFANPLTRRALRGVPIVAMRHDATEAQRLRVPQVGLSVLSRDGKRVETAIDLAQLSYDKVPAVLAEVLEGKPPAELSRVIDAQSEFETFRRQQARILNAIDAKDLPTAERICREEAARRPDGLGPRLLRHTLRAKAVAPDYFARLPADRPIRDAVYVVPDVATFLHTIAAWGDGPIFPILFLDNHYLPLFLEAYRPAQVLMVPRARAPRPDAAAAFRGYAAACSGGVARDEATAAALWKGHAARTPGVVFTHPDSPMLAAGIALAAGRRQLLAMMAPVADPTLRVGFDDMVKIRDQVQGLFRRHLLAADQLYDDVDYVTLATEQPFRYYDPLAADRTTYAVDDAIARGTFELPQACVGRLLGGPAQSLYMAMCALFLTPRQPLLFSRYQDSGTWAAYRTERAEKLLQGHGLQPHHVAHPQATLAAWQELFRGKVSGFDLVHVNSSGGSRNWSTSSGNGSYDDLPLTVPTIVSYVHSNSLGNGYDSDTVGGRWLHNGAYSFWGSTSEPYLDAFVNAYAVYRRAFDEGQPLGMAHRLLPLQMRWRPWKLMLFGDPLIRLRSEVRPRDRALPAVAHAVPLAQAASRNPFGLRGSASRLFRLQCLALQGKRPAVQSGLSSLLSGLARDRAVTDELRSSCADLVAWACLADDGLATLRRLVPRLQKAAIRSPRLAYVAHALYGARLHAIAQDPTARGAGDELEQLAPEHVGFGYSKVMYQRIGSLYKPVLGKLSDGARRRDRIKAAVGKLAGGDQDPRAFISAL